MRIWFCRSNDIGGWLIRLLTFSHWNHVAIELHGVIYEAMAGQGVRILSLMTSQSVGQNPAW